MDKPLKNPVISTSVSHAIRHLLSKELIRYHLKREKAQEVLKKNDEDRDLCLKITLTASERKYSLEEHSKIEEKEINRLCILNRRIGGLCHMMEVLKYNSMNTNQLLSMLFKDYRQDFYHLKKEILALIQMENTSFDMESRCQSTLKQHAFKKNH
jgi:hypothetical protein